MLSRFSEMARDVVDRQGEGSRRDKVACARLLDGEGTVRRR